MDFLFSLLRLFIDNIEILAILLLSIAVIKLSIDVSVQDKKIDTLYKKINSDSK